MSRVERTLVCCVLIALVAYVSMVSHRANQDRALLESVSKSERGLNERLVRMEAHFTGHKIIAAKNGVGLSFEPCKLGTADCTADDKGITINGATFIGWYTGVNISSGVMETPGLEEHQ